MASSTAQEQHEPRSPVLQPWVTATVDLDQHTLLGHSFPADPVFGRTPLAGAGPAGLGQDSAHRLAADVHAFQFTQQLGQVGVSGSGITGSGQGHDGSHGGIRNGVGGTVAPVPMGQGGAPSLQ